MGSFFGACVESFNRVGNLSYSQPSDPITGNLTRKVIFTYSLGHMNHSKKVSFFYAVKGRNGRPGLFERLKVQQLGRCVLMAPYEAEKDVEEFLLKWNCPFTKKHVLVGS